MLYLGNERKLNNFFVWLISFNSFCSPVNLTFLSLILILLLILLLILGEKGFKWLFFNVSLWLSKSKLLIESFKFPWEILLLILYILIYNLMNN